MEELVCTTQEVELVALGIGVQLTKDPNCCALKSINHICNDVKFLANCSLLTTETGKDTRAGLFLEDTELL